MGLHGEIQVLPITLKWRQKDVPGYNILNILSTIKCLDQIKTPTYPDPNHPGQIRFDAPLTSVFPQAKGDWR
jgi:hypothetical protein